MRLGSTSQAQSTSHARKENGTPGSNEGTWRSCADPRSQEHRLALRNLRAQRLRARRPRPTVFKQREAYKSIQLRTKYILFVFPRILTHVMYKYALKVLFESKLYQRLHLVSGRMAISSPISINVEYHRFALWTRTYTQFARLIKSTWNSLGVACFYLPI